LRSFGFYQTALSAFIKPALPVVINLRFRFSSTRASVSIQNFSEAPRRFLGARDTLCCD
jgi:hypothetical protein